ncbi:histidine kinase dimerization/phospho-acceptor domain-containing protein [Exilibacterium tricleocarpae]|uniref:histidine kinase dimerization/phospho-acceptor domain-containing protein n=1 Tax=Exilibacterium tricleocarpae TaxID=2591008 RepID=UPI0015D193D7|nr:histidine kinase dimerization/phospho-acceptor domain-containing protein [Exilibacterium tricleocarpae]
MGDDDDLYKETVMSRDQQLAAVSHALRQPLQSLGLYLSVLQHHLDSEDTQLISNRMRASLRRASEILDRLADHANEAVTPPLSAQRVEIKEPEKVRVSTDTIKQTTAN